MMNLKIGISSCLLGQTVRFDGGHKRLNFAVNDLEPFVEYINVCPEMGIGLPSPRPALRLNQVDNETRIALSSDSSQDFTAKMQSFAETQFDVFPELAGYIVCAKSPSCGMERVRIYNPADGSSRKESIGIYTAALMKRFPYLPIEEDGRLSDPLLRENFVGRIFALHELQSLKQSGLTRAKLITFHTNYKLLLLSHSQPKYRELGKLVADIKSFDDINQFYLVYRDAFMSILKIQASRKNHTNVLMHVQGYFKDFLTPAEKQELANLIERYRLGTLPLLSPLTLINHYIAQYSEDYLKEQRYFSPYPEVLRLRYGY